MPVVVGGVRLKTAVEDAVFVVACSGLLTKTTVKAIRLWIVAAMPQGAESVLVDYRACVIALSDDELRELASPYRPVSPPIPLAWLVHDEATAEMWRRQMLRLALAGQRRFASCEPEQAFAWAKAQAQLAQAAARR